MPAAAIRATASPAAATLAKNASTVSLLGGHRSQAQGRLGDDAQRALRADEEVCQVVAGHVLDRPAAGPDDAAVGEHDLKTEDGVAR